MLKKVQQPLKLKQNSFLGICVHRVSDLSLSKLTLAARQAEQLEKNLGYLFLSLVGKLVKLLFDCLLFGFNYVANDPHAQGRSCGLLVFHQAFGQPTWVAFDVARYRARPHLKVQDVGVSSPLHQVFELEKVVNL